MTKSFDFTFSSSTILKCSIISYDVFEVIAQNEKKKGKLEAQTLKTPYILPEVFVYDSESFSLVEIVLWTVSIVSIVFGRFF